MPKENTKTETTDAPTEVVIDVTKYANHPSTSAKIRAMAADGFTTVQIHKHGGLKTKKGNSIRYQHVRNVLTAEPKRPATPTTSKSATK